MAVGSNSHRYTRFSSMLPRDYVQKTLQRLLPTPAQLANATQEQLLKVWATKQRYTQLILDSPAKFLEPNKPGQLDYLLCNDPNIVGQFFFAGNKSGKTTGTCLKIIEHMAGKPVWGIDPPYNRTALTWPVPQRWVYFTEDFLSHEETIVPHYLTWCPKWLRPRVIRSQNGMAAQIIHANGSILFLRTYEQGFAKAEGKDWDGAAFDEPPPRELYVATFRGLVARGGKIFIGATLLKEAWLYDELQNSFNKGFNGEIFDNPWLDKQVLQAFISTLDEDEAAVRIHGKPITMVGLIYPEFQDAPPFVVAHAKPWNPLRELPYPTVMAVDPHERKPLHILWGCVTPNDGVLWYDWKLVKPGSFDEIFDFLELIEQEHLTYGWSRTSLCIMDPNRGTANQAGDTSWQQEFELRDYSVLLGLDDVTIGHTAVRDYLRTGRMRFTDKCRGLGGPVQAMLRYSWDDWQRRLRDKKSVKEQPKELFKDWPDCVRYTAMAQLSFDGLQHINDRISMVESRGRKKIRAYV